MVAVAIGGLAGCGEVYLGERQWACKKQPVEYTSDVASLPGITNYWRFNEELTKRSENSVAGGEPLEVWGPITGSDGRGDVIRIGGEGTALVSGDIANEGSLPEAPRASVQLTKSLTYALWISLSKSWLEGESKIGLLSTQKNPAEGCIGHALELQRIPKGDTASKTVCLVFRYFDNDCLERELTAELEKTPLLAGAGLATRDAWGLGKWYHVAATIQDSSPNPKVTLYWDAVPVAIDGASSSQVDLKSSDDANTTMYLGSDDKGGSRLKGLIDDVALFDRAMDESQVESLRLDSFSRYAVQGVRWATWDGVRSQASWGPVQSGGVAVDCEDGQADSCGATAVLDARLQLDGKLQVAKLDYVTLNAELPAEKKADFLLSDGLAGRQFCKWSLDGFGGAEYRLSVNALTQAGSAAHIDPGQINELKWCKCDTCECDFTVRAAMIGSEWTPLVGHYPCVLCNLEFSPTPPSAVVDNGWRRGAIGPNGHCWRPIAYDASSHAQFVDKPDASAVRATLSGPAGSTALLAADFGIEGHPFKEDDNIVFCANLRKDEEFQIIVKSANEGYCQMLVEGRDETDSSSSAYPAEPDVLNAAHCKTADEDNPLYDEDKNRLTFDPANVRYVGIQKRWSLEQEATIRIDSLSFDGDRDCGRFNPPNSTSL